MDLPDARAGAQLLGRRRGAAELDLELADRDRAQVLERVDHDEPPARRIATRCATRSTSDSVCEERNTVRPCARDVAQQRVEALLDERIEPGDRLVEDQQLRLVHERLDQPELLAVAGRELADRPVELGFEALRQRVAQPRSTPPRSSAR